LSRRVTSGQAWPARPPQRSSCRKVGRARPADSRTLSRPDPLGLNNLILVGLFVVVRWPF
jgi:hypothetical protein